MANVLIITATIQPPQGVPYLARTDPQARRADYMQSLRFYLGTLGQCFDRIVFAENSNSDVSDFQRLVDEAGVAGQVDVFSFSGLEHPAVYGKAFGEFKLLDHVHANVCPPLDGVLYWKVTGRYQIRNVESIVQSADPQADMVCHSRDYRLRLKNYHMPWTDMYFFAYNNRGYDCLLKGLYSRFREDLMRPAPELVFRALIDEQLELGQLKVQRRFRHTPLVEGVRGSDNKRYLDDGNRWKARMRRMTSVLLPNLWI